MTRKPSDLETAEIYARLYNGAHDLDSDLSNFAGALVRFLRDRMWETGWFNRRLSRWMTAPSLVAFINSPPPDGLGAQVEFIYALLRGPAEMDEEVRAALRQLDAALTECGIDAAETFEAAIRKARIKKPMAAHGGTRRQADNISLNHGTNAEYLTRRLARDYPDIAQQLADGGFKSVRAAAKAAGIVRDPTIVEQFDRLWRKASCEERDLIRNMIESP